MPAQVNLYLARICQLAEIVDNKFLAQMTQAHKFSKISKYSISQIAPI